MTAATMFDDQFTDRIVVVTGATKGLGRAVADGFARSGARLVVTSRHQDECDALASELMGEGAAEAVGVAADMADEAAVTALADAVHDQLGTVDVLVNNAGLNPGPVMIDEIDAEMFRAVFATNVWGPVRLATLVAAPMRERRSGSIVNVTTVGAYRGASPVSVYGASKAAPLNFTQSMAMEWAADGVRVNAVSPGPFRTPMMDSLEEGIPGFYEFAAMNNEQKRVGDPEELVPAVLYLASDLASYVTGEDHIVAGGYFR